ncbi:MAG: response regulator transcription factor [Thermomicrobiales bacterium]|nr:response regulator transcription factor [Thermomicrobiales bacterium]
MAVITLVLVDDLPATRQGLRMLMALEPDLTVVGEAGDGVEALALIETVRPDVVVMDTAMPGMDGIAATRLLQERGSSTAVIVHSIHDDPITRAAAAAAGAVTFVGKHEGYPALLAAIRDTART